MMTAGTIAMGPAVSAVVAANPMPAPTLATLTGFSGAGLMALLLGAAVVMLVVRFAVHRRAPSTRIANEMPAELHLAA